MRITIAVLAMAAMTLFAMTLVFDDALPFSLPVIEAAPAAAAPASATASGLVQTQGLAQEETWSKGYAGAGCAAGGHY